MDRRTFLRVAAGVPTALAFADLGRLARAESSARTFQPAPGRWRTFDLVTRVDVLAPSGVSRVWLPVPVVASDFQKPLGDTWSGNGRVMQKMTSGEAGLLYAEFAESTTTPTIELISRVTMQDRAVDWGAAVAPGPVGIQKAQWTAPTDLLPTDGIVRTTALEITKGQTTDLDKVRAVYEWVVTHTYREASVRGCGSGDIRAMLESGKLGGKCSDINGLFVGLLRSVGVPARDLYGIRVAPSSFGYKTLGAASANVTKSQHCRAEVFLEKRGWVAMDPADVAKVAREESADWMKVDDPVVAAVRPKLFGGWEGNWIAFNDAHDVMLPYAATPRKVAFLMYPQGETARGPLDSLDADNFRYQITAREITD